MAKFGKYAADGSVESEATECILTERPLADPFDNTVCYRVPGTKLFYRVLGSQHHRMTEEMRRGWEKEGQKLEAPAYQPKAKGPASEVKND